MNTSALSLNVRTTKKLTLDLPSAVQRNITSLLYWRVRLQMVRVRLLVPRQELAQSIILQHRRIENYQRLCG